MEIQKSGAVVSLVAGSLVAVLAIPAASAPPGPTSPTGQILAAIERVAVDVRAIADILSVPTVGTRRLSSGPFNLPEDGAAVDWVMLNTGSSPADVTVTVYRYGIGIPRTIVAPGAVTMTIDPLSAVHNANDIPSTFEHGYYYEVVVETDSAAVRPGVHVWKDDVARVIPGTLIPSGSWTRLP